MNKKSVFSIDDLIDFMKPANFIGDKVEEDGYRTPLVCTCCRITLANVLASANYSSPDKRLSPEVMAGREFQGDTDLTELSSGES